MQPRMVMHPYRTDLNGQELINFTDPRGVQIFVEFASLVRRQGEGYISYVWQWKDDPQRLEPKESFVKGFEPWGWIIGTGIYIDDVEQEIARIEQNLITASLIISGLIVLLLLFVLEQSLHIERERQEVVDNLRESTERFHSLVEATTEGTLLILNGSCKYANPILLRMTGYTLRQMEFLELVDLLPRITANEAIWEQFDSLKSDQFVAGKSQEGCLKRIDNSLVDCILSLNPIAFEEEHGLILLVKEITQQPLDISEEVLGLAAQSSPVGIFRARAYRRGVFLTLNQAGRAFLSPKENTKSTQPALADFFSDPIEYEQVFDKLLSREEIKNHLLKISNK